MNRKGVIRFSKYAAIGVSTLTFDLLLIAAMTELVGIPYYIATPLGFLIAVSINYALSRVFVFKGTDRGVSHGYVYFILIAVGGALAITGAVWFLVTFFSLHYLVARIGVAGVVGLCNYLANLHFNFKVAGLHL